MALKRKPGIKQAGEPGGKRAKRPDGLLALLAPISAGLPGRLSTQSDTLCSIASKLMTEWDLIIAGRRHSIAELEAYVHSSQHADPYTHGDEGQLSSGCWYFHRKGGSFKAGSFKGLDLACGSPNTSCGPVHAGLLLRSIQDCVTGQLVEGPSLLVDHILKLSRKASIADFVAGRTAAQLPADCTPSLQLVPIEGSPRKERTWRGVRVGLVLRSESDGKTHSDGRPVEFCTRAYRFSKVPQRLTKSRSSFAAVAHLDGDAASTQQLGIPAKILAGYLQEVDAGRESANPNMFVDKKLATQGELCRLIGACDGILRSLS